MRSPYIVIKKPVVTEKSMANQQKSVYTFIVAPDATKPEVKQSVEKAFNVKVESVRTMIVKGKVKRYKFASGRQPDWKKAIVRLREGNQIDIM